MTTVSNPGYGFLLTVWQPRCDSPLHVQSGRNARIIKGRQSAKTSTPNISRQTLTIDKMQSNCRDAFHEPFSAAQICSTSLESQAASGFYRISRKTYSPQVRIGVNSVRTYLVGRYLSLLQRCDVVGKQEALYQLAQKRKSAVWPGYSAIADFHGGIYECDHVSPYTKSAGNLSADIFVMLQDWSSSDSLNGPICHDSIRYGHTVAIFTNSNLKSLLHRHFDLGLSQTYGSNLFPFIKPGPMNAGIPQHLMDRAAVEFGLPQIDIIKPKLVICFGKTTFNALRASAGIRKVSSVGEGIEQPFKFGRTSIWLQAHTGRLGQNNRNKGGVNRVEADWQKMAREYRANAQQQVQGPTSPPSAGPRP